MEVQGSVLQDQSPFQDENCQKKLPNQEEKNLHQVTAQAFRDSKPPSKKLIARPSFGGESSSSTPSDGTPDSNSSSFISLPDGDGFPELKGLKKGSHETILHGESAAFVREKATAMNSCCEKIKSFFGSKLDLSIIQQSKIKDVCLQFVTELNPLLSTFGFNQIIIEKKMEKHVHKKSHADHLHPLHESPSFHESDESGEKEQRLASIGIKKCEELMAQFQNLNQSASNLSSLQTKTMKTLRASALELLGHIQQVFEASKAEFFDILDENRSQAQSKFKLFSPRPSYIIWSSCQFKTVAAGNIWAKCKDKVDRFCSESVLINYASFLNSIENRKILNKLFKAKNEINEIVEMDASEDRKRRECDLLASYWDGLHDFTDLLKNFRGEDLLLQELIEEFVCTIEENYSGQNPSLVASLSEEARKLTEIKKIAKFLKNKTTVQRGKKFSELLKSDVEPLFGRIKRALLVKKLYALIKKETLDESIVSAILVQIAKQVQIQYVDHVIEVDLQKRIDDLLVNRKKDGAPVLYLYPDISTNQSRLRATLEIKDVMVDWKRCISGGMINFRSKDGTMIKAPMKAIPSLPIDTPDATVNASNKLKNKTIDLENIGKMNTYIKGDGINDFGVEGIVSQHCFKDPRMTFLKEFRELFENLLKQIPSSSIKAPFSESFDRFEKLIKEFLKGEEHSEERFVLQIHELIFCAFDTFFKDAQMLPYAQGFLKEIDASLVPKYPEVFSRFNFVQVKDILSSFYRCLHQALSTGALAAFCSSYLYVFSSDKTGIKNITQWADDKTTQINIVLDSDNFEFQWLKRRELGFSSWFFNQDLKIKVLLSDPSPKDDDTSLMFFYQKRATPSDRPELRFKEVEGKRCLRRAALLLSSMKYPAEKFVCP